MSTNLEQYFRSIWHNTPGIVHLAAKGKEPTDWHATLFAWPADERKIIEYVQRRTIQHEVFVNPVLYQDTGVRDRTALSRENVLGSWVLWADFDGNAKDHWFSEDGIPEPSMKITTSTESHQHCYWELDELVTDPDQIEAKNRTIAYSMDADRSGWDFSQLLRPPDTTNHGYGKNRKGKTYEVRVEETSDRVYQPTSIVENDNYRPKVYLYPNKEVIPHVTDVLSRYTFPQSFQDLFNFTTMPEDRSGALFTIGCQAAELGLTDLEIYSVLDFMDVKLGKFVGRHDHDIRLVRLLDSVRKKIPFGLPSVEFSNIFGDIEVAPKSGYTFGEFMALDLKFAWHYEGLFPLCGYVVFYGAPGVGKTLLGMDFVNCAIQGIDWLMWQNKSGPIKVLFLSLEMNQAMLQEQYRKMTDGFSDEVKAQLSSRLRIYPLAETLPLDKPEGRKYLTQILSESEFHPDIILIDSLSELSEKSLSDDEPARNLNRFLRHLRNRYNVGICVIHHNKKLGGHSSHSDLDDMWGSRFIGTGADTILYFEDTHPRGSAVNCIQDKTRMSAITEPFLIERNWYNFSFTYDGPVDQTANEKQAGEIGNALRGFAGRKPGPSVIDEGVKSGNGLG